jgi:hypothetical protein
MRESKKILSIEYLRIFALCTVVLIHFNAKGFFVTLPNLGFSLELLSRFAEPLFFPQWIPVETKIPRITEFLF